MLQTLKGWIEALFKSEGAWRTWAIVVGSVVVVILAWWFIQVIIGYDINGVVSGWFS